MTSNFYCEELRYPGDAAGYFSAIAGLPHPVWLDSCNMARFDILSASPHHMLEPGCSFADIRAALGVRAAPVENIPFAGGALGCWGYDQAALVGIYDWALVLDHREKTARLVSHRRFPETCALLAELLPLLRRGSMLPADDFRVHGKISCNFTKQGYARAFDQVQRYLHSGDCYQVNLAQRFCAAATGDALHAYLALRKLSPAPYSAYLDLPGMQILCASPERFISIVGGEVETRPIKGTRPRHSDPVRDQELAAELAIHPKDRAENLMIVDLLRNDLGKICEAGTVRVPKLFEVESYAHVHHLVSTVQGSLAAGRDALDLLDAVFPGGSITGAPKLRAMQIIAELEPDARGVYCRAIGYVGFDGNMDSNIVIRTLVYRDGTICCWAGGGLVADSVCDAEYQETLDKAAAMLELLKRYGGTV